MDEALNKKVRIFDIIQFETMGYGVYNLFKALLGGNHLFLIGMISFLAVPILFILYKNMWHCSPYQYGMMEILQGALVLYSPADDLKNKSIGLGVMLICTIIKYAHYCHIWYFDYEFKKEVMQNKTLAYIWGILAMFLYAGIIGNPGILSFAIAIPLGLLLTWILSHKNMEKEIKKREKITEEFNKKRQAEMDAKHKRWEAEEMAFEAQQREWREEREYKENFRQKMFNEQQSTASGNSNAETTSFFKGCSTIEELEARHKSLAKAFHPDSNAGDTESYQEMQEEYERLKKEIQKGE